MSHTFSLSKNKLEREQTIDYMIKSGKQSQSVKAAGWWYVHHYLQGARKFRTIDYEKGEVTIDYAAWQTASRASVLEFKYEGVMAKCQAQMGRLLRMDLSPVVAPGGIGLEGMRGSSVAQVVLNAAFGPSKELDLRLDVWHTLVHYGTAGLAVWVVDNFTMGVEVVPPWELLPIPDNIARASDARGLIRRRKVPLDWVKGLDVAKGENSVIWDQMEYTEVLLGSADTAQSTTNSPTSSGQSPVMPSSGVGSGLGLPRSAKAATPTRIKVVEFAEAWIYSEDNHLKEYVVWAGGKELWHKEYDVRVDKEFPPIHVARYISVGGFLGRSYAETLIPLNSEVEYMSARLFQNIEDLDKMGIVAVSSTMGINFKSIREIDGVKFLVYEPDYTSQRDTQPISINPPNTGLMPVKTLQTAVEMLNDIAAQPSELMAGQAPGRVDSSASLGMLVETSNVPLAPAAASVAAAVTGCYKFMLNHIRKTWDSGYIMNITRMDDNLAGIEIDPSTGEIKLQKNAIPHPDEVIITIASQLPKSAEQDKMQLVESLKLGALSMTEFRILVRKKNLDYPVGGEIEWQNYRRATLENIMLFGDGSAPGRIMVTNMDVHQVHLMVLDAFMARPEFLSASQEVIREFINHRNFHLQGLGVLPEQAPYPEEAAGQEYIRRVNLGGPPGGPGGGTFPSEQEGGFVQEAEELVS